MTSVNTEKFETKDLPRMVSKLGPWCSAAALWVWTGTSWVWFLPISAGFLVISLQPFFINGSGWRLAGLSTLVIAIVVGFSAENQITSVVSDWDQYWNQRVDEVGVLLREELEERRHSLGTEVVEELVR